MEARPSFSIANKIFFASLPRPALPYVQTDSTTPNIVGPAMLTVVARLTGLKLCATNPNNTQQYATNP